MSETPTPRTDAAIINFVYEETWLGGERGSGDKEIIEPDFARTLETELTAANARIAELDKRISARETLHLSAEQEVESLTRQLSEAQAQLADMTDAWDKIFNSRRINGMSHTEAAKALIACNEKLQEENELLNQLVRGGSCLSCAELKAQLASAREDGELLNWLEINHIEFAEELHRIGWKAPNDAQWEKLKFFLRRIRHAIKSARGDRPSPPASAEPGPASTWQPIDTAPRDGTEVLFVNKWGGFRLGFYSKVWANFVTTLGAPLRNIVYWQPLPPPPTQDEKEQGK